MEEDNVLTREHIEEAIRVLSRDAMPGLPWVVSSGIFYDMKQLGICTDGFIAAAPYIPPLLESKK